MNKVTHHSFSNIVRQLVMAIFVIGLTLGTGQTVHATRAAAGPAPVNLGAAAPFAILTKTGVTNVPTSDVSGNIGTSPIASTAITGFSLVMDSTGTFSRSAQVAGKVYAANYASPTPANLTTAVGNMQTAYADAAGRSLPDFTELYAGNLSGRTLTPGLYKWSSGVMVTTDVTLAGPADAVWIFQIAGNLTMGSGAQVLLSGGAHAKNIFWQVGGGIGVEIGTTAHIEGTILAAKAIHLRTGASLNGRALAQTAVTLAKNKIVLASRVPPSMVVQSFTSRAGLDGWVLESDENSNVGGTLNSTSITFALGDSAMNKQYRGIVHFDTSSLPDDAVITRVTLKIMQETLVGTNPFSTHGALRASIRQPFFGANAVLQTDDFQAGANNSTSVFDSSPMGDWYLALLSDPAQNFVSLTSSTQFRLHFGLDDNDDNGEDYMKFYSGNEATLAHRPRLVVEYYVP